MWAHSTPRGGRFSSSSFHPKITSLSSRKSNTVSKLTLQRRAKSQSSTTKNINLFFKQINSFGVFPTWQKFEVNLHILWNYTSFCSVDLTGLLFWRDNGSFKPVKFIFFWRKVGLKQQFLCSKGFSNCSILSHKTQCQSSP